MDIVHDLKECDEELIWLIGNTKYKEWKAAIMKMAVAEVVYSTWHYRNNLSFGQIVDNKNIERKIIENIVYRRWHSAKLIIHMARMMM